MLLAQNTNPRKNRIVLSPEPWLRRRDSPPPKPKAADLQSALIAARVRLCKTCVWNLVESNHVLKIFSLAHTPSLPKFPFFHQKNQAPKPSPLFPNTDYWVVLDGQQRLTSLNLGLLGSFSQRTRYQRKDNPDCPEYKLYMKLKRMVKR